VTPPRRRAAAGIGTRAGQIDDLAAEAHGFSCRRSRCVTVCGLVLKLRVETAPKIDVRLFVRGLLDDARRFLDS